MKKKHAGAFQDDEVIALPHRPISIKTDVQELNFTEKISSLKFTVDPGDCSLPFRIMKNDAFFKVEPESGKFTPGEKIDFTVSLVPENMPFPRIYNGMLLIRLTNGFSRTVGVYADLRNSEKRRAD
jgi:hypothetical protein